MYTDLNNIQTTIDTLKESVEYTEELPTALNSFEFKYDEESKEPYLTDSIRTYYFDLENTFAIEQLCALLKIKQFSFFIGLSTTLQEEIVKEQIEKITPNKNKVLFKIREGKEKNYLRAVLNQNYITVENGDIIEDCRKSVVEEVFHAFSCKGYELDSPALQNIFVFNDSFTVNEQDFNLSIEVLSSDLGDQKFELYGLLYQPKEDLFYRIPSGDRPYFQWSYRKSEPNFVEEFGSLYQKLLTEKNKLKDQIEKAMEDTLTEKEILLETFNKLELEKAGPGALLSDLKTVVFNNSNEFTSFYDLARYVSELSLDISPTDKDNFFWKGKIFTKIGKYRGFAGTLLGLNTITKE